MALHARGSVRAVFIRAIEIGAVALVVMAAKGNCDHGATDPSTLAYDLDLTLGTSPLPGLAPSGSGDVVINLVRKNGLSVTVSLRLEDLTDGKITATDVEVPFNQNAGTFTFRDLTGTAALGPHTIRVTGTASETQPATVQFTIVVAPNGTFALTATRAAWRFVAPGTTLHSTVTVTRSQFTLPVTLTVTPPAGLGITSLITTSPVTGTSADIELAIPAGIAVGTYQVDIKGSSGTTSALDQHLTLAVTVTTDTYSLLATAPRVPIAAGDLTACSANCASVIDVWTNNSADHSEVSVGITATSIVPSVTGLTVTPMTFASHILGFLQITAGSAVPIGTYQVTLTGKTDGQLDKTTTIAVRVVPPGGFGYTFAVGTTPLPVAQGATSADDPVTITRTNFPDAITVSGTSDQGITVTATPATTTANTVVKVAVPLGASVGLHTVTLKGVGGGIADYTTTFQVNVSGATNTTWTFCPSTGLPLWVATQDASGPWIQAAGTNGAFPFNIAGATGGIAYVVSNAGITELHVFYGTQLELQTQGASLCPAAGATRTVSGTVSNTGTAANVHIGLGASFNVVPLPGSAFTLPDVPANALDLMASTVDGAPVPSGIRMLMRRGVTASDLGALSFTGSESFVPDKAQVTLVNATGPLTQLFMQYHTNSNALTSYYVDPGTLNNATSPRQFFGVPVANQAAGDLHYLTGKSFAGSGQPFSYRFAGVAFGAVTAQSLTFGPVLGTPTFTKPTGTPALVQRATLVTQAEYGRLWQVDYDQTSSSLRLASVQVTAGYRGTSTGTAVVDLPDFTGVAGWSASYGLVAGVQATWRFTAAGWSPAVGATFVQLVSGATFMSGTGQGTVTP